MPLRYNDRTGEFEEVPGSPPPPSSGNLRYNPATGEFEPIRGRRASTRRPPGSRTRVAPPRRPDPRTLPAARQAATRERLFRNLSRIALVLGIAALVFCGWDTAVALVGVVFSIWFAYRLCTGAIWPWVLIALLAAIHFLPAWLCIAIAILAVYFATRK